MLALGLPLRKNAPHYGDLDSLSDLRPGVKRPPVDRATTSSLVVRAPRQQAMCLGLDDDSATVEQCAATRHWPLQVHEHVTLLPEPSLLVRR